MKRSNKSESEALPRCGDSTTRRMARKIGLDAVWVMAFDSGGDGLPVIVPPDQKRACFFLIFLAHLRPPVPHRIPNVGRRAACTAFFVATTVAPIDNPLNSVGHYSSGRAKRGTL